MSQPGAALLRQIYETKILAQLFGGVSAAEQPSAWPIDPLVGSQAVSNGEASGTSLCTCERATVAAQLLQQFAEKTLQASDLPGAADGILQAGVATSWAKQPLGASWPDGTAEPVEGPCLPLSAKTLIGVLRKRLEPAKTSQGETNGEGGRRVICSACSADVTRPLQQLLDSCLSFAALCRLNAFPFSREAEHKLGTFALSAKKREKRPRDAQNTASGNLPARERRTVEEKIAQTPRSVLANGTQSNSSSSSCSFPGPRLSRAHLHDGPPTDRLELRNCKALVLLLLISSACIQAAVSRCLKPMYGSAASSHVEFVELYENCSRIVVPQAGAG